MSMVLINVSVTKIGSKEGFQKLNKFKVGFLGTKNRLEVMFLVIQSLDISKEKPINFTENIPQCYNNNYFVAQ
jgi:hypothetical protein